MKGSLRIDKDGVFVDGRRIETAVAVTLNVDRESASAVITVFALPEQLLVDLQEAEIEFETAP